MPKKSISLSGMKLEELLALKSDVDARIAKLAAVELSGLEQRMATLQTLANGAAPKPRKAPAAKTAETKVDGRRKPSPAKGKKVPPKYKDPKSGKTWTGRGAVPVWMREYEGSGKKRDDFLIAAAKKR